MSKFSKCQVDIGYKQALFIEKIDKILEDFEPSK